MGARYSNLSYPIAEIYDDGTAIIQKQPDQNGMLVWVPFFSPKYELFMILG